jgi:hypothetical protein
MELVMELTGCGPKEAAEALLVHKEIWLAVDALLKKPEVSGDKYVPQKPKIDTGLDEEQQERCEKGRWLQEKVNAVFSVAHSKIQTQQDEKARLEYSSPPVEMDPETTKMLPPASLSQRDAHQQTTPPTPQSESLQ